METKQLSTDITILGGGLAGLACALQIKQNIPHAAITVLERRPMPYPEATHKVGESTVEIGAHYFSETLGLKDHLKSAELRKLGIRLFFSAGKNSSIVSRSELGSNRFFHVPTYQIDRGRFENHLTERLQNLGVAVISPAKVVEIEVSENDGSHRVCFSDLNKTSTISSRWIVDASGRAALLKRKFELAEESAHDSNAIWFRLPGKINIDSWSADAEWLRDHEGMYSRWFSTNHLTGEGYWVWIIPLSSNYTSIGIVTDPKIHPLSNFRTYEDSLRWLEKYEPECAAHLHAHPEPPADYLAVKHYAHKCSRVMSPNRWAITGDAGIFLDPLYSPGSDFIAIQNTFITDCIKRDFIGERFIGRCEVYNELFIQLTDSVLNTFLGQYPILGNPRVMPLKVIWDYSIYWGFLAFVTIQDRLCDIGMLRDLKDSITTVYELNNLMQAQFRIQNTIDTESVPGGFLDIYEISYLHSFNRFLSLKYTHDGFVKQLVENIETLSVVADKLRGVMGEKSSHWKSNKELLKLLNEIPSAQVIAA